MKFQVHCSSLHAQETEFPKNINAKSNDTSGQDLKKYMKMLESPIAGERFNAVLGLESLKSPIAIPVLKKILANDPDLSIRKYAINVLIALDDKTLFQDLIGLLKENNIQSQIVGIYGTKRFGKPEAIPYLKEVLNNSKDPQVNVLSAIALAKLGEKGGVERLKRILKDPSAEARNKIVLHLIEEDSPLYPDLIPELILLTKDTDKNMQHNAFRALKNYEDQSLVPIFIVAVKGEDAYIRRTALEFLQKMIPFNKADKKEIISALKETLKDKDQDIKRSAARILSDLDDPATATIFLDLLKNEDRELRVLAIRTVGRFGIPSASPILHRLKSDPSIANSRDIVEEIKESIGKIEHKEAIKKGDVPIFTRDFLIIHIKKRDRWRVIEAQPHYPEKEQYIQHDKTHSFMVKDDGISFRENGKETFYPLPDISFQMLCLYRGIAPHEGFYITVTEIDNKIGPVQRVNNKIWFGISFYSGEGVEGLGGFGYFDLDKRQYLLFRPRPLADYSVSAIYVDEPDVWLGTINYGEGYYSGNGVIRLDIQTGQWEVLDTFNSGLLDNTVHWIQKDGNLVIFGVSSGGDKDSPPSASENGISTYNITTHEWIDLRVGLSEGVPQIRKGRSFVKKPIPITYEKALADWNSKDPDARLRGVEWLGILGEKKAIPLLMARLKNLLKKTDLDNNEYYEQHSIFITLGKLKAAEAESELTELFEEYKDNLDKDLIFRTLNVLKCQKGEKFDKKPRPSE